MGRDIKRVALDFDWPLDKVWEGYVDARVFPKCEAEDCEDGQTADAWAAYRTLTTLGFEARRLPRLAKLLHELTGKKGDGMFGWNGYDILAAIVKAAGLDHDEFYKCAKCAGTGYADPKDEERAEDFRSTEPPAGEGWQLWENVSEGSPITPVFPTADALVDHLCEHGSTWDSKRGDRPTRAQAEALVNQGGAFSAMTVGDGRVLDSYQTAEYLEKQKGATK